MNRYLLVSFGYSHLAIRLGDADKSAALIAALADAVPVESKGYGDDQRYVPASVEPVQMQFVNASRFTVGDEVATLKAQLAEARQQEQSYSKYWTNEQATSKKLKAELDELKKQKSGADAPTPTSPPAESDDVHF